MIFKCIICIYHGHYLIFSLCYCGRNVSPHCHMFTCMKGGGGLPSPHRKILGNHVQYFRSQCSDSNASIPYQCCRWLLPCCFPLTEPNSAVIALIMPQSQPTSIAFTLPMLLPLDPHYSGASAASSSTNPPMNQSITYPPKSGMLSLNSSYNIFILICLQTIPHLT